MRPKSLTKQGTGQRLVNGQGKSWGENEQRLVNGQRWGNVERHVLPLKIVTELVAMYKM